MNLSIDFMCFLVIFFASFFCGLTTIPTIIAIVKKDEDYFVPKIIFNSTLIILGIIFVFKNQIGIKSFDFFTITISLIFGLAFFILINSYDPYIRRIIKG